MRTSGMKLIDRKLTIKLIEMLGVTVLVKKVIKAAAARLCRHMFWSEKNILKEPLDFQENNTKRTKAIWKKQVETLIKEIGLSKDIRLRFGSKEIGLRKDNLI